MRVITSHVKLVLIIAIVLALALTHFLAFWMGGSGCEARHARKQLEMNEKIKIIDEKIDQDAPNTANKRKSINWLLQYTRSQ